jgi:hypothetical protein
MCRKLLRESGSSMRGGCSVGAGVEGSVAVAVVVVGAGAVTVATVAAAAPEGAAGGVSAMAKVLSVCFSQACAGCAAGCDVWEWNWPWNALERREAVSSRVASIKLPPP